MKEVFSEILAIKNSKAFTPFVEGVQATLPDGRSLLIKIRKTSRSVRPEGLRYSKHAFVTEVAAGDFIGFGYGEGRTQLLAMQKSIAEGVERSIYHAIKGTNLGTLNSSGWAAHVSQERATFAATEELLERDAVLVHWLCQKPMTEIDPSTWPKALTQWVKDELSHSKLNQMRILTSNQGYVPTATVILTNSSFHGVASHATSINLGGAVEKALAEACRIAQIAGSIESVEPSLILEHIKFYSAEEKLPTWLFGQPNSWQDEAKVWKRKRAEFNHEIIKPVFHEVVRGPITVGYVTSEKIQALFFGNTQDAQRNGLINFDRLKCVGFEGVINLQPHLVA